MRKLTNKKEDKSEEGEEVDQTNTSIMRPPAPSTPEVMQAPDQTIMQAPVQTIESRTIAGQYPLIVDQGGIRYIPWQNQDLEGLVKDLPNIHEGAAK